MAIGRIIDAAYGRPEGVTGNPISVSGTAAATALSGQTVYQLQMLDCNAYIRFNASTGGTAATSADVLLIEGNWYCFKSPQDSGSGVEISVISRSSGTGELNIAEMKEM